MNLLYISDLHLPVGPKEALRPEMRRSLRWLNGIGNTMVDRFEEHLRCEAHVVTQRAYNWLDTYADDFSLLINGGDLALPLSRHEDRLEAAEKIWTDQLATFGESKLLTVNGNHELGHGYNPLPSSYADLLELRHKLFDRPINRESFGFEQFEGTTIVAIDSELAFLAKENGNDSLIASQNRKMLDSVTEASKMPGNILIVTHNTVRAIEWLMANDIMGNVWASGRQAVMLGGHFHIPRSTHQDGIEIHWAGGGSYPEPFLRLIKRMPFTGLLRTGPGGMEVQIDAKKMKVIHRPFSEIQNRYAHAA